MNSAARKGYKNNRSPRGNVYLNSENREVKAISVIANNIDAIPSILNVLNEIQESVALLQKENLRMRDLVIKGDDCWMDAEDARVYMRVSKNTFDNYRYSFNPRLIGHPVGGKTLYKKSDIDHWVRTYQYKSADLSS